jgi:alkylhydroperoxidase family enzyme
MPRLPLVDPDDPNADSKAAALLGLVRAGLTSSGDLPWTDINVYRAMANHPDAFEALLTFGERVYRRNGLTPAQRELAYLGASVANDCHY